MTWGKLLVTVDRQSRRNYARQTACKTLEAKTSVLDVRIKLSVKAMVERLADADGRSLANYVERLIEAADEAERPAGKKPKST